MDFKNFCKDQSFHTNLLKEYKDTLEQVIKIENEPKYPTCRKEKDLIKERSFYGNPETVTKNDFEKFLCPIYNKYEPYEDKYVVQTFCDKCEGRPSVDYLGDTSGKVKRKPHSKRPIPEHLMGRIIHSKSQPVSDESEHSDSSTEPKMLYKITVKTNDDQTSGTSSPVFIRLIGVKTESELICLGKKCGSLKFAFAPGSKEVFHIRSVKQKVLKIVHIELEAKDSNDEWFVDWISIEELAGDKRKWFCKLDRWLSSRREKCELRARIKPESNVVPVTLYKVNVHCANDSVDNFNGYLTIILNGSERNSECKALLINDKPKVIKKGTMTTFEIKCQEVGQLKGIRIAVDESSQSKESEYDSDGKSDSKRKSITGTDSKAKGWKDIKIEKIVISWRGSDKIDYEIEFLMDDWIGLSHKMKKKSKLLKDPIDLRKQQKKSSKEISMYDVTFHTGKKTFSGTDSTVFVKFYGSYRTWSKTYDFVDYDKKRFESGKEDSFRINGPSVGSIEKINISHNNTGIAAGWKLEKVTVIRHLTSHEICSALEELKRKSNLPKEIVVKDGIVTINQDIGTTSRPISTDQKEKPSKSKGQTVKDTKGSESSSDSSSEESYEDNRKSVDKSKSPSHKNDDLVTMQLPYAEESTFICKKWLSEDNKNSTNVTIDVDKKTLLYSSLSVLLNID